MTTFLAHRGYHGNRFKMKTYDMHKYPCISITVVVISSKLVSLERAYNSGLETFITFSICSIGLSLMANESTRSERSNLGSNFEFRLLFDLEFSKLVCALCTLKSIIFDVRLTKIAFSVTVATQFKSHFSN